MTRLFVLPQSNRSKARIGLTLLTVLALLSGGTPKNAVAATRDGVTMPDTYAVDGQSLLLNGLGVRKATIFGIRIYVAGLYLPRLSHDSQQILTAPGAKVLVLQFVHSGTKTQVEDHYREGEENACANGGCPISDKADFERLVAAAPAVEPGDKSIFVFNGSRVKVFANDRLIADFVNQDLGYRLLAGFIGQKPASRTLRSGLLGLPDE